MTNSNTIEQEVNQIRLKIYEETKDMTDEEVLAYFHIPKEESIFKHIRND